MSDTDNPTPSKKRKRAARSVLPPTPAANSATAEAAEVHTNFESADSTCDIPLDPLPSDIVIDSTWKNIIKFRKAIASGLRLKDPAAAPAAADEVPETASEGQDVLMEDQAASGVDLTEIPDTSASATAPITLPQIWDWENAPTVPSRKFVVVAATLVDAKRKAAGVMAKNAAQLKVWSILVKDELQEDTQPFTVYGTDDESTNPMPATVLTGGALDEVICADQAEAIQLGEIVCGLLDRLPFYISWEEWHSSLGGGGHIRVRRTILRRLVQARALDLWRPSFNRLNLPEPHRELQLGILVSSRASIDIFDDMLIAQSVRVFVFDLPPLVYTTTTPIYRDNQVAKRTGFRISITYNQLDIEKVNELPDVPNSFAYKFAHPPGPLSPEKRLLLKAFHAIQYRLTFKSGTQRAIEQNAAAEIRKLSKASVVNRGLSLPKASLPKASPPKIQTDANFQRFAPVMNGLAIYPAAVAGRACTGKLPDIIVYHRSSALAAYVLNKMVMMRAEGRDLRNIWKGGCLAADLVSKSLISLDAVKGSYCGCGDSTDRSLVQHVCMICLKAFPCKELLLTEDHRRICQSHSGAEITRDQPITPGLKRYISRLLEDTKRYGPSPALVDVAQLKAKLFPYITDSRKHKWQDGYAGERSTPHTIESTLLSKSSMSPFQPSVEAVHRFIMVDGKIVQHHQYNVALISLCLNYAKNKWGVAIIAVLGAAARQTQKERNGEARDQKIWNDIHNSMDRLHRLSMQVTPLVKQWDKLTADQIDNAALESWHDSLSSSVWEPGQPSPVPGYRRSVSTAGDYVSEAEIKSGQRQAPLGWLPPALHQSAATKTVIPKWFEWNDARKKRLSKLIDEMQNSDTINPGNKVKLRRSDTGAPWPFRGDHEFTGDSDLWDWLFHEVFSRFWTMFWTCNVRHDTAKESPDTIFLEIVVQYFRNGGVDSFIHCEMTPFWGNPFSMSIARRDGVAPGSPMMTGWTTTQPVSLQEYDMNRSPIAVQPLCINLFWSDFDTKYHQAMFEFLCTLPLKTEFYGKLLRFTRPVDYPRESRVSWRRRCSNVQDLDEGVEEELQQESLEEYGVDRTEDPIDAEESDDDEMDGFLPEEVQHLRDALSVLREEIQEADPEFLEMAECRAWLDGMRRASKAGDEALFNKLRDELIAIVQSRQEKASQSSTEAHALSVLIQEIEEADPEILKTTRYQISLAGMRRASKAGDETRFNKLRDGLVAFVQSRQEKASLSNTETCCVCGLLAIEGSMLRCSNSNHTNAVFHFDCLNDDMTEMPPGEPTALCPDCQSKDHDADAGFQVAGDSPKAPGGENDEVPCDECSQTFKDSAMLADHTKEAHSRSTPDASSTPAITEILRALQDSQQKLLDNDSARQQGQIELQQVVSAMQQGQQQLQQGLQHLLDNAPAMQQGQDDLQHMASAMQEGQQELQHHVSKMQEGQQKALHEHSVTQRGLDGLQTKHLEMKADVQQIQRELQQQHLETKVDVQQVQSVLQQQHLEMKDRVQRMQEQQNTNVKRLELKVLQQQRERNEEFVQGLKERANEKKHAEERLRERAGTLEAKCQPSEREIKLLDELEEL